MTRVPEGQDAARVADLLVEAADIDTPHGASSHGGVTVMRTGLRATVDPMTLELQFESVTVTEEAPPEVFLVDQDGTMKDLPSAAEKIFEKYTPPPPKITYTRKVDIERRERTVGVTPAELFRLPVPEKTGVTIDGRLIAVDAVSGAIRKVVFSITGKRLNAGILQVGTLTVTVNHQDAATSTWRIDTSTASGDFVVTVTGAAGRTVDWLLVGTADLFGPGGIA